jgi:hypothetical protein
MHMKACLGNIYTQSLEKGQDDVCTYTSSSSSALQPWVGLGLLFEVSNTIFYGVG